jgi:hypothetical protein
MSPTAEWDAAFPADYAHAVGVFALRYNALEHAVFAIFCKYAPGNYEAQARLYAALHNKQRRDLISDLTRTEDSIAASDAVAHAMECFNVCSENRNILLHAAPVPHLHGSEKFVMFKASTNKPQNITLYEFTVEQVRGAADSVLATEIYIWGIVEYWHRFANTLLLTSPPSLPDKPHVPCRLSSFQRRPTQAAG